MNLSLNETRSDPFIFVFGRDAFHRVPDLVFPHPKHSRVPDASGMDQKWLQILFRDDVEVVLTIKGSVLAVYRKQRMAYTGCHAPASRGSKLKIETGEPNEYKLK
jgi:hypothetical protein